MTLDRLRFTLIRLLAGRDTVVLNFHFAPGISVNVGNDNFLAAGCTMGIDVPPGVNSAGRTEDLRALRRTGTWLPPPP